MKIVIAPDSFKESLSAKLVCDCVEKGFKQVLPKADYIHLPLADGGEGTVDVILQNLAGSRQREQVAGPLGHPLDASWALIDDGNTAVIELAAASGLDLVPHKQRNPELTSSYGTGQLIKAALDLGVQKIIIGLGGSATNDGGSGIVQALGGQLLDEAGNELKPGGAELSRISSINLTNLHSRCHEVEVVLACDVTNPLTGHNGASFIFGPQKGASKKQVERLDLALQRFSKVAQQQTGKDYSQTTGFGAAGGAPLGLSLLFDIRIESGIEMVLDLLHVDTVLAQADLLITGEGRMDNQTLNGKTPIGIARRANAKKIPVIAIAGSLGENIDTLYGSMNAVFGSVRAAQDIKQVLEEAEANVIRASRNIAANLVLGHQLGSRLP
ncbi:glycerate kinase [Vibrio sp. S4M6]|uniref:glycerate kinase n=1 Tax=Vibrio sinus TaxID=2946865 RepID=UPI002029DB20|nr:glycerate kinase [Vibrio sinus]MCL9782567.1 glycerate kinase [Vibrio sinus]